MFRFLALFIAMILCLGWFFTHAGNIGIPLFWAIFVGIALFFVWIISDDGPARRDDW